MLSELYDNKTVIAFMTKDILGFILKPKQIYTQNINFALCSGLLGDNLK